MKFANYSFCARGINNLGDQMQIIAIDNIYREMEKKSVAGVKMDEIVYIDYHNLKDYDGEYVILPVTMPMVDYYPNGFADRFSDHIIPVFLGVTMVKETLSKKEIEYLKKYEPIGCRDERTLNTMRKYGIFSYLNGCITVTFPKRENNNGEDVFIVDLDPKFYDLLPDEIKKNAKYRTHLVKDNGACPKELALEQYNEYLNDAKLVITSLLHCSTPCVAAGIPVILLNSETSYRKAWLEKILPIYTMEDISCIDWNPNVIDIESHKERVLQLTIERLLNTYNKFSPMLDLSFFYENREKKEYINDACRSLKQFVDDNWIDYEKDYRYSIWGLTQSAEWIVDYISNKYKNALLCHVYDSYRTEMFRGLTSESPNSIKHNLDEVVLVTTNGAEVAAKKLFDEIGLPKDKYALFSVIK